MNIAGFSLSNWMTYGFSFLHGDIVWRFPIAFQLVFSIILFLTVPWLPESPRWLLAHGYEDEAVNVLIALEGDGTTAEDSVIIDQKVEILEAVRLERETAPSLKDIFRGKTGDAGMVPRLLLGAGLWCIGVWSSHSGTDILCQVPSGCNSSWGSTLLATSKHGSSLFLRF
jgi:hypothetical protein